MILYLGFPVNAMSKQGWIQKHQNLKQSSEKIIRDLIDREGGPRVAGAALYRKKAITRANAKTDPYALKAWCWQVLSKANENRPKSH